MIKGQPGGPREEDWTESGALCRAFLGTELREVIAEMAHCDHGAQLLLFADEETEAQRVAKPKSHSSLSDFQPMAAGLYIFML